MSILLGGVTIQPLATALALLALPSPVPPEAAGLAPGYFLTAHGCVASMTDFPHGRPSVYPSSGSADTDDASRARYAESLGRYDEAVHLYARALKETDKTGVAGDSLFRLPLSVALLRANKLADAKAQWRLLLKQRVAADAGTDDVLAGRYRDAFAGYATMLKSQSDNPIFLDSGASYNLQRGLNEAARGDYSNARRYLGYSLECTRFFDAPHLVLGVIDAMKGDYAAGRLEWAATLEGLLPAPGVAGLSQAKSDALRLLLRFS